MADMTTANQLQEGNTMIAAATTRVILVHLNVEVPSTDERTPDQITDALLMCFQVGYDGAPDEIGTMTVDSPLAEEV